MPNNCTTKGSPCWCILYVCECVCMGLYVTVHTCECLHVLIWERNSPGPGKVVTEIACSGAHEHWHFLYAWEILVHGLNQIHRERFWISNTHQIIKWGIVESSLPIIVEGKAQNNGINGWFDGSVSIFHRVPGRVHFPIFVNLGLCSKLGVVIFLELKRKLQPTRI